MTFTFRNSQGQGALRDLLNPLVTSVLDDRNLLINTNPVEVYKKWINDTETATGQPRYRESRIHDSSKRQIEIKVLLLEQLHCIIPSVASCRTM